jgi:hypothetical protein
MSSERDILPADQLPGKPFEGVTERVPTYPVERAPLPAPLGRRSYTTLLSWLFGAFFVVMAVGLLLPAVQKVRDNSTRMRCWNNMKLLVLAIQSHAEVYEGRLPAQSYQHPGIGSSTFFCTLLPFAEQEAIYKRAIQGGASWNNGTQSTVIKSYLCPSDSTTSGGLAPNGRAVSNYSTNVLLFAPVVTFDPKTGKESCYARYKLNEIPDGTSVVAIVERYGSFPASGYSSLWAAPCGGSWGWPETSHAYGMWSTGPPESGVPPAQARYDVPNAGHAPVNVAMIDGSVRSIGPMVGAVSWLRAITPDDGLLPGPDWE